MSKEVFIFLSDKFYTDFPHKDYPEIEQKRYRPYIQVLMLINNTQFAIPLRSNITHPHVLWTDKDNKCGVDFTKAVVITSKDYIDNTTIPHIRENEFNALRGKAYKIKQKMEKYIKDYKKAKVKDDSISKNLVAKSTLQYFEEYL